MKRYTLHLTCDRCGAEQEIDAATPSPWVRMSCCSVGGTPEIATVRHLCPECVVALAEWLRRP